MTTSTATEQLITSYTLGDDPNTYVRPLTSNPGLAILRDGNFVEQFTPTRGRSLLSPRGLNNPQCYMVGTIGMFNDLGVYLVVVPRRADRGGYFVLAMVYLSDGWTAIDASWWMMTQDPDRCPKLARTDGSMINTIERFLDAFENQRLSAEITDDNPDYNLIEYRVDSSIPIVRRTDEAVSVELSGRRMLLRDSTPSFAHPDIIEVAPEALVITTADAFPATPFNDVPVEPIDKSTESSDEPAESSDESTGTAALKAEMDRKIAEYEAFLDRLRSTVLRYTSDADGCREGKFEWLKATGLWNESDPDDYRTMREAAGFPTSYDVSVEVRTTVTVRVDRDLGGMSDAEVWDAVNLTLGWDSVDDAVRDHLLTESADEYSIVDFEPSDD